MVRVIKKLENLQTNYYVDLGNGSYTWRDMCVGDIAKKVDEIVNKTNEIIDYINEYPIMTTPAEIKHYTITSTGGKR